MNPEIFVPVTFFVVVLLVIKTLLKHRQKKQEMWHQTLQIALQQDKITDAAMLEKLASAADPQRSDLRKAILFFVLTVVFLLLAALLPFDDPQGARAVITAALLPLGFAITYLGFWKFWYK